MGETTRNASAELGLAQSGLRVHNIPAKSIGLETAGDIGMG